MRAARSKKIWLEREEGLPVLFDALASVPKDNRDAYIKDMAVSNKKCGGLIVDTCHAPVLNGLFAG